jgi:hypothetical protein
MLFVELVHLARDPRDVVERMHAEGPVTGARIVSRAPRSRRRNASSLAQST